jgi:hypothetical protein
VKAVQLQNFSLRADYIPRQLVGEKLKKKERKKYIKMEY